MILYLKNGPLALDVRPRPDLRRRRPAGCRDPLVFAPVRSRSRWPRKIAEALRQYRVLVAEAGTGTGKTFAYLVPALLAGGKGHHLHGHQDPAGPALQPRPAHRARRAQGAGEHRPAQGPRQPSATTTSSATRATAASSPRRTPPTCARSRASPRPRRTAPRPKCTDVREELAGLDRRHLDARQLPRPGLSEQGRVLRDAGAAQRHGRRRGGGQSPPLLCRRDAARRGHG